MRQRLQAKPGRLEADLGDGCSPGLHNGIYVAGGLGLDIPIDIPPDPAPVLHGAIFSIPIVLVITF